MHCQLRKSDKSEKIKGPEGTGMKSHVLIFALTGIITSAVMTLTLLNGASPHAEATNHPPPTTLHVGLDMSTSTSNAGVYNMGALPPFESCVQVNTSVNSGIFYIDVFLLNVSQLVAFNADVEFNAGQMQILEANVNQLMGTGAGVQNLSWSTPDSGGFFEAAAANTAGTSSGAGVLVRLKAQAFIPPAEGRTIDFKFSTQATRGVILTNQDGQKLGDTNGDGIYDGPFINAQGRVFVNRSLAGDCTTTQYAAGPTPPPAASGDVQVLSVTVPAAVPATTTPSAGTVQATVQTRNNGPDTVSVALTVSISGSGGSPCNVLDGPQPDGFLAQVGQTITRTFVFSPILPSGNNCRYTVTATATVGSGQSDPNLTNNAASAIGRVCLDQDNDGFYNDCPGFTKDNCPTVANPNQADWNGDGIGDACQDQDNDGWVDVDEFTIGTDASKACATTIYSHNAWPPDINNDRIVDTQDILLLSAPVFFKSVGQPGYMQRRDIHPDGIIDTQDVLRMSAPVFFKICIP